MRKTSSESTNHLPKTLRRNIKLANLVPFNAEINISAYDAGINDVKINASNIDQLSQIEFALWAEKHNIRQYPKLFRYLSSLAQKKHLFFQPFNEFKRVRDFMKVLVGIAEEYQKVNEATEKSIRRAEESQNEFFQSLANDRTLERHFIIGYSTLTDQDSFRNRWRMTLTPNQPDRRITLGKSLFESAISSYWLSVNENHQVQLSQGKLLDSIDGIDLRRIKQCINCQNIIWAYRLNQNIVVKNVQTLSIKKRFSVIQEDVLR